MHPVEGAVGLLVADPIAVTGRKEQIFPFFYAEIVAAIAKIQLSLSHNDELVVPKRELLMLPVRGQGLKFAGVGICKLLVFRKNYMLHGRSF
jgi:hypothetical protein